MYGHLAESESKLVLGAPVSAACHDNLPCTHACVHTCACMHATVCWRDVCGSSRPRWGRANCLPGCHVQAPDQFWSHRASDWIGLASQCALPSHACMQIYDMVAHSCYQLTYPAGDTNLRRVQRSRLGHTETTMLAGAADQLARYGKQLVKTEHRRGAQQPARALQGPVI